MVTQPLNATKKAPNRKNVWWGVGVNVEAESVIMGVSAMIVRMFSFTDPDMNCLIRVSSSQVGPGLGGGGDGVLVIATGITSATSFPMAKLDGGWHLSLFTPFPLSATITKAKGIAEIARLIRAVPLSVLVRYVRRNPLSLLHLKEPLGAFCDTLDVGTSAVMEQPKLWMFSLIGAGFEAAVTYQFGNKVEFLSM